MYRDAIEPKTHPDVHLPSPMTEKDLDSVADAIKCITESISSFGVFMGEALTEMDEGSEHWKHEQSDIQKALE